MCLAAALHQLREGPLPPVASIRGTIGLIPGMVVPEANADEDEHPLSQVHDGSSVVAFPVSHDATVADVGLAEGRLMGWSGVCIRHLEPLGAIQPEARVGGSVLSVMPAEQLPRNDDTNANWCFIPVPVHDKL